MATETHIKVSGTWQKIKEIHVKVSGSWQKCKEAYAKVSGTWQKVYQNAVLPKGTILPTSPDMGAFPSGWGDVNSTNTNGIWSESQLTGAVFIGVDAGHGMGSLSGSLSGVFQLTNDSVGSHSGSSGGSDGQPSQAARGTNTTGAHTHTFNYNYSNDTHVNWVDIRFAIATGPAPIVPQYMFGLTHKTLGTAGGVTDTTGVSEQLTSFTDRVPRIHYSQGTDGATGGSWDVVDQVVISSTDGSHSHGTSNSGRYNCSGEGCYTNDEYVYSGAHNHTFTCSSGAFAMKRRRLLAFGSTSQDWDIRPGMIIMWLDVDLTFSVPEGWYECDGTNGTPDMRDYFLALADTTTNLPDSVPATADNVLRVAGGTTSSNGNHNHNIYYGPSSGQWSSRHYNSINAHTHTITGMNSTWDYKAPALKFLMKAA